MEYKRIPQMDFEMSALSLGTWVYGGDGWGETSDKESQDAIRTALDMGVNTIDTAPVYGQGRAETLVGEAVKKQRHRCFLATKCGLVMQGKKIALNLKGPSVRAELEHSLRRLQTDYIDLYQCHWPDPRTPVEETMHTLNALKQEGKIRYIGISNFPLPLLQESLSYAAVMSVQNQYSLLDRRIEEGLLPFCRQQQLAVLTYGSLAGGILTGKYQVPPDFQKSDVRRFFYRYYEGRTFERICSLMNSYQDLKRPWNEIALNWARQQKGVTSVIVGCRSPRQVRENIKSLSWDLSEDELARLNSTEFL